MSTRHYASDVDDVDDLTYRMLDSRFCRIAMHAERHDELRHRRAHDQAEHAERRAFRKVRRPRPRYESE